MKFLCVPCDRPMKLQTVAPPDRGSLSVVYSCPSCGYEMAMLTNPYETQLVQSLGVRVGVDETAAVAAEAPVMMQAGLSSAAGRTAGTETQPTSKCPFAAMVPSMVSNATIADQALSAVEPAPSAAAEPARSAAVEPALSGPAGTEIRWTSAAEARLANIPAFVRPMARTGIERFAREQGCLEVDEKILDAARDFFGM